MTEQISEETKQVESPWFIDEGIQGTGQKPNWLPDKFKTVADMAKSYSELEKKVGVAPDEYKFNSRYLDPDYTPFDELKQLAKDKRVPQEVIDKMLDTVDRYMDEFSVDYNEEIKKIGDNALDRVKLVDNWAKSNLSKDSYDAISSSLTNAEAFKALEELRGKFMSNEVQVPTQSQAASQPSSVNELKAEMSANLDKYSKDEAYRKDWQKRMEIAVKNTPDGYIDKMGG